MAEKKYPVSLTVKAVDKASDPLRRINAEIAKLEAPKKIAAAEQKLAGMFKTGGPDLSAKWTAVTGALSKVGSEAFALGAKLLTLVGVAAFAAYHVVRSWVDAGDKLAELSDRARVAVDWFASMRYAAEQADVPQEEFNSSIDKFVKSLGDAKAGGGKLLEFLKKVSPTLGEQIKGAKSTEQAFSLMTDAFTRLNDPMKLSALGAAAFGREAGPKMANFLHQGSGAIQEQQLKYLRLAGSQEKFARGASDLDNALRDTETAFQGLRSVIGGELFPVFKMLAEAVTAFVVKNRDGIQRWAEGAAASMKKWIDGGGVERLITGIGNLASGISSFIDTVGGLGPVLGITAAVMAGPLLSAIAAAIPAVYGLGAALLATPVGWVIAGIAAIAGAAYLIYKNWEPIKGFFSGIWDDFVGSYKRAWEWIEPKLKAMGGVLRSIFDPFGTLGTTQDTDPRFLPPGAARQRTLGTPLGADSSAATQRQISESNVTVKFDNLPSGARVTQDRNSDVPIDLELGYSSVAP